MKEKEIELRFKISTPFAKELATILSESCKGIVREIGQNDVYYRKDKKQKFVLRVRQNYCSSDKDVPSGGMLTYKENAKGGGWKEIETPVYAKETQTIIGLIGLEKFLTVKKDRISIPVDFYFEGRNWRLEVNIDTVYGLGKFVEVEVFDTNSARGERVLREFSESVGLKNPIKEGYVRLLMNKQK